MYRNITIAFVWLSLLVSCSNDEDRANANGQKINTETTKKSQPKEKALPPKEELNFEVLEPEISETLQKLSPLFSHIPYYAEVEGPHLFYVVNGEWEGYDPEFGTGAFKMGLLNQELDTLLPPVYDKIYNPDLTAKGFIETKKDDLRGL